jgi:phosphatidylglycerol---prolipoprotein diacylglyceryl transferase
MYASLYDLILDLTGLRLPFLQVVNTFGLLVALSVMLAYRVFKSEFTRRHKLGQFPDFRVVHVLGKPFTTIDYVGNGVLGFIMGYKVVYMFFYPEAAAGNPADFMFSGAGSWWMGLLTAGILLGLKYREDIKQRLPEPMEKEIVTGPAWFMGNIAVVALVAGFAGAKLFHILEDWQNFTRDPLGSIFSGGGWTFYGGLIGGGAGVLLYCRKKGMNLFRVLDVGAPGMMLAYGTGRLGCHLSGDGDWGIVNTSPRPAWLKWLPDWAWAYDYPNNVIDADPHILIPDCESLHCNKLELPVYPTPLYEFLLAVVISAVLWYLRRKPWAAGMLFSVYLVFAGIERWLIETIRVNTRFDILGISFSQAQFISFLMVLAGVAGLVLLRKKKEPTITPDN